MAIAGVVSLLFITSVWFGFARRDGTLVTMEIPLEYVRRDSNFVYVDADVDTVRLQLSGAEAMLKNISATQLKARVGLSSGVIGENIFKLEPDNFSLPPGVVLRKVTPESVTVSLDIDVIRSVPVQVDWVGTVPFGSRIEYCELIPEQVQVRGPSLLMEEIATVYTEAVDVAALSPQLIKDVPLVVPQAARSIEPATVTIRCSSAQSDQ
jgi:YbbR domain-containing protein